MSNIPLDAFYKTIKSCDGTGSTVDSYCQNKWVRPDDYSSKKSENLYQAARNQLWTWIIAEKEVKRPDIFFQLCQKNLKRITYMASAVDKTAGYISGHRHKFKRKWSCHCCKSLTHCNHCRKTWRTCWNCLQTLWNKTGQFMWNICLHFSSSEMFIYERNFNC